MKPQYKVSVFGGYVCVHFHKDLTQNVTVRNGLRGSARTNRLMNSEKENIRVPTYNLPLILPITVDFIYGR